LTTLPTIQIRQQSAQIGINRQAGKMEIKQPPPTIDYTRTPAKLEMEYYQGELVIDQGPARNALGIGSHVEWMSRVKDEAYRLALEGIGKIVEKGNRMAAIHQKANVISDMAFESVSEDFKINYEGPFSYDSVDIQYTPKEPYIHFSEPSLELHANTHAAEINYTPAVVEIYLAQKAQLEFIPPQIDVKA
jgi:hypothetical protein